MPSIFQDTKKYLLRAHIYIITIAFCAVGNKHSRAFPDGQRSGKVRCCSCQLFLEMGEYQTLRYHHRETHQKINVAINLMSVWNTTQNSIR